VQDGQPQAEIVIAEKPKRTVRLAAHELQTYVKKISGARLPIVFKPSEDVPVAIYVGRSSHTKRLHISAADLKHGAYRIVSGDDWLALIGQDTEFSPIEPWPRNNNEIVSGKLNAKWDQVSGQHWGNPLSQLRKHRLKLPGDIGWPDGVQPPDKTLQMWGFDERGSFNAVCGFLRRLGVRWYAPGELGEVVPRKASIPLPNIDQTVHPDFAVRRFNIRFGVHGKERAMWAMRLGMRDPYGLQIAHGMTTMTRRSEIMEAHPKWFALYNGKRQNEPGDRHNHLCYSNEELFRETVRYVRTLFDHYRFDAVSVMPPDGFVTMCQCSLCKGKDTPQRNYRGLLSDYVWDFVNRVAKEVRKTHPDKWVTNCAYGTYSLPPQKIEKLEPNVLVCIVGGRRPRANRPQQQKDVRRLREGWVAKTDNPIMIFENYPFTARGWYLPAFVARTIGESINATKGISMGEDIWYSVHRDFEKGPMGFNHFQVYFTARMHWGGKDQDADKLLDEYCRLFYGPAGEPMKAFFTYCESHWQDMEKDKAKVDGALQRFAAAKSKVVDDSIYGRRIELIDEFLETLRNKRKQLGQPRGPVPNYRLFRNAGEIVIDGVLDEAAWKNWPLKGRLRELQTGRPAIFGTTFQGAWGKDGSLYFAIHCDERPGEKPNVGTNKNDDQALWFGDVVEILLETDSHSYYQIAVSPSGAIVDLDRSAGLKFDWDSQAEVATRIADDHWTVEIRIPVIQDENDPLHQVIGRKPSVSLPWHFNICRQRIRETGKEYSAYSPTGEKAFHDVQKFGQLYVGRSHQFDHADPDDDYLHARRQADRLSRQGKRAEALTAFAKLARREGLTEFQKYDALDQAAAIARRLKKHDRAAELADEVPIKPAAKTIRMQNLLAERKSAELIERFGKEDLATWPFWNAGEAYLTRGRAFSRIGKGREAERSASGAGTRRR